MGSRLYVGNLSYETNADGLRAAFVEKGYRVKDVHIVMDRDTGRPRGFGFVELADSANVNEVVEAIDGLDLDGRNIRVNEARERESRGGRRDN